MADYRAGLSARQPLFGAPPPPAAGPGAAGDQVQINMEAGGAYDVDQELEALHGSVGRLKQVSEAIAEESRQHNQLLDGLEGVMMQARGALGGTMRRLNRVYTAGRSNHMMYLFLFAAGAILLVWAWAKVMNFLRWIF